MIEGSKTSTVSIGESSALSASLSFESLVLCCSFGEDNGLADHGEEVHGEEELNPVSVQSPDKDVAASRVSVNEPYALFWCILDVVGWRESLWRRREEVEAMEEAVEPLRERR